MHHHASSFSSVAVCEGAFHVFSEEFAARAAVVFAVVVDTGFVHVLAGICRLSLVILILEHACFVFCAFLFFSELGQFK